jgi:transcriptional regulator with XRE-family HTH domain
VKFEDYASKILKTTEESYVGSGLDLRFNVMEFIMRELLRNRMTQSKLAIKLKMKPSQLSRILKAESNLTIETIARIYHALGCKPIITEWPVYSLISDQIERISQTTIADKQRMSRSQNTIS